MVSETGVTFPWESQAMRGDDLPMDLGYADQVMYLSLRLLYATHRKGIITREQAVKEKKQLLEEYRMYKFREDLEKQWVEQIRLTELARAEYRKNPTVDNGMKLVHLLEGRKPNAEM